MDSKFFLYQIIAIAVIWGGMAYFFDELYPQGKIIFYVVTSWLLFLIVVFIRRLIAERRESSKEDD